MVLNCAITPHFALKLKMQRIDGRQLFNKRTVACVMSDPSGDQLREASIALRKMSRIEPPGNSEQRPALARQRTTQLTEPAMNLLVKTLFLLCIWDYRRHMRKAQTKHS
jgi:hypothetical protein